MSTDKIEKRMLPRPSTKLSALAATFNALRRSTVARITVSYLCILLLTISALGAFVYWQVSERMWQQLEQHIASEVESLAEQYRTDGLDGVLRVIDERLARVPDRRSIYLVEDKFGRWLIGNISAWPTARADAQGWLNFELFDKAAGEMTKARVQTFLLPSGARLLVGRDTGDISDTTMLIQQVLAWGVGLALIVGCGLAILFSRRAWAKLHVINETSRQVVAGDMNVRIPTWGEDYDLDDLSININKMLEELNQLMSGIERVSDNIAHDLRTPLARVRNRLGSMSAQSENEMRRGAAACVAEIDELIATFNALLRIAKLEGRNDLRFDKECDINNVVANCVELYAPVAEEKQQHIEILGTSGSIFGDEQLINQALCNLLDNAIKFSTNGQTIYIALRHDDERCIVEVIDQGCGLNSVDRDKVLQRFYRGEQARNTKGNGLGLALVKAIADAHDAELQLHDNAPGLKVSLAFPANLSNPNIANQAA